MSPSYEHHKPTYEQESLPAGWREDGKTEPAAAPSTSPPKSPGAPLGSEATEASQRATAYGKATPSEAHRPENVSPAGQEPVKVRKDFF